MHTLAEIKTEEVKKKIVERCGPEPDKQGLVCPHCGAHEVYADRNDKNNSHKWFWMFRAFKVDDWSKCHNCGRWFDL